MKTLFITTFIVAAGLAAAGEADHIHHDGEANHQIVENASHVHHSSALDHAPAGIMPDHLHGKGEWMLGYHYMRMEMSGHRKGRDELSTREVFDLGFTAAAESMTMDMHMIEIMYAPTDWLTLMAMTNYVFKDMDMTMMAGGHGHGAHGSGMMPGMGTVRHSHSSEGLGDTSVTALFPAYRNDKGTSIIGGLEVSMPTGSVDEKENGVYLPYGMQLGSGTWDLLPSVTAVQNVGQFQFGAQLGAVIRLEEEGDSGFSRGERYFAHGWVGYEVTDWLAINTTLSASTEGELENHYNDAHLHNAPPHFQGNYGGDVVNAGLGFNLITPNSWGALFGSQRIGVRATLPVYQDLNGVGMNKEWSLFVSYQKAF